eukprot:CAMPEP_0202381640 /NCGR_PEP_ID=MMETSP1127-20130417/37588_1 /ASSEMBLY_ACC=CAM_ASM_000462 /TAXON_ID=3047 /ORGANISM="Dunaliella tertiolecta, Strain CCMP1320" /LENGTH=142 /DNA_ID=CAMNT_0048980671 /DNA_START=1 /DNA_END=429 /DNA_ORIENTATION=+
MPFRQQTIKLPALPRGCHLVHDKVLAAISSDLQNFKVGMCNVFCQHSSASITVNENCDPDVRHDMETFLNKVVSEGRGAPWVHTAEGPDDMPAHVKSSMFGCSLNLPITNGRLNLGTWQGIWLCEHRDSASGRKLVITMHGE